MTARSDARPAAARLARSRRVLASAAAGRPLLVAIACALAILAIGSLPVGAALPARARPLALLLAAAAVAVGAAVAWRRWRRVGDADAALWIERRVPGLDYALATLADARVALPAAGRARLESRVAAARWEPAVRRAALRATAMPAVAAGAGLVLLLVAPPALARVGAARRTQGARADAPVGARADAASRALGVRVRVVPPAYSGLRAEELGDVSLVPALVGSTIELRGGDRASDVRASLDDGAARVLDDGGEGWRLTLAMPARAAALRLERGAVARLLVLEPRPDSAPVVTLRLPLRDTVLRTAAGILPLSADARDDLGMVDGRLEYIVSSGEGENFRFRTGVLGARGFGRSRAGTLVSPLDLAALALEPGDVVHLRAVARDANPRGTLAASETRTLRVQRRGEADSVAIEAAPPPEADKSLVSQRMLIQVTERLVARMARLARPQVVAESRRIGVDQRRLRRAVGDVVFARLGGEGSAEHAHGAGDGHDHSAEELAALRTPEQVLAAADRATGRAADAVLDFEGDETPVVAINRPLLEAYNAMWEASQSLDIGEPREALPPMRRALEAIQRARAAERIYLRGRPPAVVVDLARVRLAGKERGDAEARAPRTALPDARRAIAARLARASVLATRDADAAADTLLVLRIEALGDDAALARALGDAAEALRRDGDATAVLVRARRAVLGDLGAAAPPGAWRGGWSTPGGAP